MNDVGMTLLLRVESCLAVSDAQRGRVTCPGCGTIIQRDMGRRKRSETQLLRCGKCGWQLPWKDYRKTFHNKHLGCAGMFVPCQEFARDYPKAGTYQEKIILIDTLIHRFHWQMEGHPGQPGAATIIGGKMSEVAEFLDMLTYSENSTGGLRERLVEWRAIAKEKHYGPRGATRRSSTKASGQRSRNGG